MSDEKLFEVNGTREGKPLTADEAMHVIACKARAVNYTWGTAQSVCDLPRFEEAREAIRAAFHQAQTTLFNNILCEELLAEEGLIASDAYRLAFNSAQRRLQEAETEAQHDHPPGARRGTSRSQHGVAQHGRRMAEENPLVSEWR